MISHFRIILVVFLVLLFSKYKHLLPVQPGPANGGEDFENYTYFGLSFVPYGEYTEDMVLNDIQERIRSSTDYPENIYLNRTKKYPKQIGKQKWYIGETACPFQIRKSNKSYPLKNRHPDAIGIGVAKSGTGSLAFLDCHPQIVFR